LPEVNYAYLLELKDFIHSEGEILSESIKNEISNYYFRHFSSIGVPCANEIQEMYRVIDIINQYSLWGLTEEIEEFIDNLSMLLGINFIESINHINESRQPVEFDLSSKKLFNKISLLNKLDIELYENLKQNYKTSIKEFRNSYAHCKKRNFEPNNIGVITDLNLYRENNVKLISISRNLIQYDESFVFKFIFDLPQDLTEVTVDVALFDDLDILHASTKKVIFLNNFLSSNGNFSLTFSLGPHIPLGNYWLALTVLDANLDWNNPIFYFKNNLNFKVVGNSIDNNFIGLFNLPLKIVL
jgi:hypothetical protein